MREKKEHPRNKENKMAQYIMTYLGGDQPSSPEEGQRHLAKYTAWLSSLGDSSVKQRVDSTSMGEGDVMNGILTKKI